MMWTKLFDLVPGFIWALIVALLAILLGVQTIRYDHTATAFKQYKAEVATATLEAEQKARETEQSLRQQVERIAANVQERQNQLARRAADATAALAGLRNALDASQAASDSSPAACTHDARTVRELLGACAAEYRGMAEGADILRNQVTGLQEYAAGVSKHE